MAVIKVAGICNTCGILIRGGTTRELAGQAQGHIEERLEKGEEHYRFQIFQCDPGDFRILRESFGIEDFSPGKRRKLTAG